MINTYTNNTGNHQIVGNAATLLSEHASYDDAAKVYYSTDYSEGDFAMVEIVAPGETIIRHLSDPMTPEQLAALDAPVTEDIFGFGLDS